MDKIKIFLCYAHEDRLLCQELVKHLKMPDIDVWYDHYISAGMEWKTEIDEHLKTSQVILLLISPDFIDSNYCYSIEMAQALERHKRGEACVIPVILRPVLWEPTPIGELQALPQNAEPVTSHVWHTRDQAFHNVAKGVREVVRRLVELEKPLQVAPAPLSTLDMITNKSVSKTKESGLQPRLLVALVILVIISSVTAVGVYQNHVNQVNASATVVANHHATSTVQANATATAQVSAYPSYLSGHGVLAFFDPLSQASGSKWRLFNNAQGGACQFVGGAYHVSQLPTGYYNWCHPDETFSDFAFEVQATITQGDCGGMVFRENGDGLQLYYYAICVDGAYGLLKYSSHSSVNVLQSRKSSAIHNGLGQQ